MNMKTKDPVQLRNERDLRAMKRMLVKHEAFTLALREEVENLQWWVNAGKKATPKKKKP